jgi:ABC-type Na+ transport system ATPase subunit NatA
VVQEKTRHFRILTTLLLPEGTATIAGFDVVRDYKSIRSSIGYMPGKFSLYQDLTIAENLTFSPLSLELRSKKTTMPLKKFTSRLSLLKIEEQALWWNEAEASFVLCLIHKPKFYFLMNLLGVDPFLEKVLGYVKRLQQKGLRYWSPLHG